MRKIQRRSHGLPDAEEARSKILQAAREDVAKLGHSVRALIRFRQEHMELVELIDDIVEHIQIEREIRLRREMGLPLCTKRRSP